MGNSVTKQENRKSDTPKVKNSSKFVEKERKGHHRHKNKMADERKYLSLGQGHIKLSIIKGDLTTEEADVVVCAANKTLDLKRGRASNVLLEAGGNIIQDECKSMYSEGIDYGDIAIVIGGNLSCKNVYFVALPVWSGGHTDRQILYDTVKDCCQEADKHRAKSVALPALGTGFLKFPCDVVAQTTLKAVEDFSNSNPSSSLKSIAIIIYYKDTAAFQAFESEAKTLSSGAKKKIVKKLVKKKPSPTTGCSIDSIMSGNSLIRGNSIGEIRINICHGNLAEFKADVLVNSTTNDLQLDNGDLSESLLQAAGPELQVECDEMYPNGIHPGEIAVTSGQELNCTKIYHGSLPIWDKDKNYKSKKTLERFVTNCLDQIEEDELRTIAFPALGTGHLNYPPEVSARTVIDCVMQHERVHPDTKLADISIVVSDEMDEWKSIMKVYEDELHDLRSKAIESIEAENGFHFKMMENVLKNALERGAERNSERGSKEWFKIMCKSEPRPPHYWDYFHGNKSIKDWIMDSEDLKPVVMDVDKDTFTAISKLVQDTWESKYIGHGRDGQGLGELNYTSIRVIKVERVENCKVYEKYAQKRQELFQKASIEGPFPDLENITNSSGPIKTTVPIATGKALTEDIYPEINEYYMFHGTKETVVDGIVKQGLDSRLTGMSAMFGQGVYGAESSTKADQYADDKGKRTYGRKKMFLTRMCLGKMSVFSKPQSFARAPCCACLKDNCGCDAFYDSVVGDGPWNFREFVVYDRTQVYPEFIITYLRER